MPPAYPRMTPERFRQVKAIVTEVSEVTSLRERDTLVAMRCGGDEELVREVESLLAETTGTIESYASDAAGALRSDGSAQLVRGRRIGAYAVIRELGRGGMGAVYLARRADDEFEKEVAIKLLKRGTDTDEVLRRFRTERDILARLEHPHVARLIDGGTTDDGLPYFVMEYVVGRPVTNFCTSDALSVEARLQLFLKICAAVQFAHQNLVVHRDLKPANILITSEGEPKLLDFGIAKLLATGDASPTLTLAEQQHLTPGYASPEQVRGEPITTVSDVYALGALLYEILTGKPAHRFTNARPSPTELLSVVAEQIPPAPSDVAADPATARRLQGDLDNIVQKALRKEPERRYDGVGSLAADVRRHLEHFPVLARKDTPAYRASKFIQRNRLSVAAGGLVLLAVLAGLAATTWEVHVARVERAKAVKRFNQVRELAHSVLFDYHDAIAALPGSTSVRQRLVQDALKYLDNLAGEAGNDRSLLRELADAYDKVAAVQGSAASSTGGTLLSAANLGDTQGALVSYGKALAIREKLYRLEPANKSNQQELAKGYHRIAATYLFSGPPATTIEYERKAITLVNSLLADDPAREDLLLMAANIFNGMARALGSPGVPNLGDTKGSLEYMDKVLRVNERLVADHPTNLAYQQALGNTHNGLGLLFSATGDRKKQLEEYLKAVELDRALVAAAPSNPLYRRELAVQLGNVGSTMVQLKNLPGALERSREALAIYEALVAADPADVSIRRNLAVGYRNVGVALGTTDPAEALRRFQQAVTIFEELVGKDQKNDDVRRQWAFTYLSTSRFQLETDDLDKAVASALAGIRIADPLVVASPANASAKNTLALLYFQMGSAHAKCALRVDSAPSLQTEHWRNAREAFVRSHTLLGEMKVSGTLGGADAGKLDEATKEIDNCDTALKSIESALPAPQAPPPQG